MSLHSPIPPRATYLLNKCLVLPLPSSHSRSSTPSEPRSPSASGISRTPSTPVVLSNGKPLKSSLKSSLSSPAISQLPAHIRSRSEPPTPSAKSVHFADSDLESVVVFEKSARPRAVSGGAEDTETETEGYDSPSAYPFPKTSDPFSIDVDLIQSSPVPSPDPAIGANVYLETILFPRSRPPTLRGSVLVKNIAFEKLVALRFTLDNWQTTSEVTCKFVCSLPALPPPFPPEREAVAAPKVGWDRFSFLIRLEDVERKLVERTIFLVARFTATGAGEWWDNNNEKNYRLRFKNITPAPAKGPSPLRQSNKRSLDIGPAPPVVRKQTPPTFSSKSDLPPPPPAPHTAGLSNLTSTRPRSASGDSFGTNSSLGSLRLSNYVSPVSPPMTPRTSTTGPRQPLPTFGPIVGTFRCARVFVFAFLMTVWAQVDNPFLPRSAPPMVSTPHIPMAWIPVTRTPLSSKSGVFINPLQHHTLRSPAMPGVHLSMAPPTARSTVMAITKRLAKWWDRSLQDYFGFLLGSVQCLPSFPLMSLCSSRVFESCCPLLPWFSLNPPWLACLSSFCHLQYDWITDGLLCNCDKTDIITMVTDFLKF